MLAIEPYVNEASKEAYFAHCSTYNLLYRMRQLCGPGKFRRLFGGSFIDFIVYLLIIAHCTACLENSLICIVYTIKHIGGCNINAKRMTTTSHRVHNVGACERGMSAMKEQAAGSSSVYGAITKSDGSLLLMYRRSTNLGRSKNNLLNSCRRYRRRHSTSRPPYVTANRAPTSYRNVIPSAAIGAGLDRLGRLWIGRRPIVP